ncbi:hypothetical protein Zmor_019988 [Zophobas morio]|uniref:Uncharacterized protein n=1 Tax=Zophobas morio TaxID=2755281 RepID=A0AA38I2K3_9CUCU|nr:hypothetical protein Zmor_019988 [Zophobas morio]
MPSVPTHLNHLGDHPRTAFPVSSESVPAVVASAQVPPLSNAPLAPNPKRLRRSHRLSQRSPAVARVINRRRTEVNTASALRVCISPTGLPRGYGALLPLAPRPVSTLTSPDLSKSGHRRPANRSAARNADTSLAGCFDPRQNGGEKAEKRKIFAAVRSPLRNCQCQACQTATTHSFVSGSAAKGAAAPGRAGKGVGGGPAPFTGETVAVTSFAKLNLFTDLNLPMGRRAE